jgi:hypothetical protein
LLVLSLLVFFPLAPGQAKSSPARQALGGGLRRVWAVDEGEKVRKYDLDHPMAESPSNPLWDGERIRLFGARNEVVAFQLILEAGPQGAQGLDVRVSGLIGPGFAIPSSDAGSGDPFDYRGKSIELFSQHYLNITESSRGGSAWSEAADPGEAYLGWVPDPLIPLSAPPGLGGAPLAIEPNANQGIWVDLWIPRQAPPGIYRGQVQISQGGALVHEIPIELKVYDFALPDESHFEAFFAAEPSDIARRHGVPFDSEAFYAIEARYFQMAHRHRFDLVVPVRNLSQMRRFHHRYLSGALYSSRNGYQGPGEDVGNRVFIIGLYGQVPEEYGGSISAWSKESWWAGSDAWANWFAENAPQVRIFKFLAPDEPWDDKKRAMIRMQADWSHSNPGPGGAIPTFVTHWIDESLAGAVDIWSISANFTLPDNHPGTDPEDVEAERRAGRGVGIYNGYRPASGSTLLDAPATDWRVLPWIGWKYGLDHYFHWMTTYWTDYINDGQRWNVFTNPQTTTFRRNGAGTLFYPGEDFVYQEENRGLPGPIASIRMKNWRRGMQDYEYLWLAGQLGLQEEGSLLVDEIVGRALWEASLSQDASWPERGYRFEAVRAQLAPLIEARYREQFPAPASAGASRYRDVPPDDPQREAIEWLSGQQVMGACSGDSEHFCPDLPLWRAQAARIFGRAIYGPGAAELAVGLAGFEDFSPAAWPAEAVAYAQMLRRDGYLAGCDEGGAHFCPESYLRRSEMSVLLLRLLHGPGYQPPPAEGLFGDLARTWWGAPWVEAASKEGLIGPCLDGDPPRFCPYAPVTRREAAHYLAAAIRLRGD